MRETARRRGAGGKGVCVCGGVDKEFLGWGWGGHKV